MLGPLPGHPQAAQGQSNGFGADQPRREALGATDLGGERECPPAGGLAKRPWTLMQERPQGLAGPSIEDGRRGVRARREGLEHGETAMISTSAERSRLALGTGEKDLAAAYGTGGRRPEPGLHGCPLVRRERAYK